MKHVALERDAHVRLVRGEHDVLLAIADAPNVCVEGDKDGA